MTTKTPVQATKLSPEFMAAFPTLAAELTKLPASFAAQFPNIAREVARGGYVTKA